MCVYMCVWVRLYVYVCEGTCVSVRVSVSHAPLSPDSDAESRAQSREELGSRRVARPVAMETGEDAHAAAKDAGWEDDKDRMVLEIVQMYSRQQERLHSTLHKQMQLEMVNT